MKKAGETITEQQLILEEKEHIRLACSYWRVRIDTFLEECDEKQRAREELAIWEEVAKKAGIVA